MFPLLRLLRIILVSLRYGLDELVLSSLNHPLATCLLRVIRLGTGGASRAACGCAWGWRRWARSS